MENPISRRRIMRAELSRIATLLIVAVTGAGCGNGGTDNSTSVLTTVEVTPATATLFTVAPGNTAALTVVAKDQNDAVMSNAGTPTFSSDDEAVATVGGDGTITAVAAGTALITASLTAGGVTKTGTTTVTAQVAPASAGVTTPALTFNPKDVDVQAGGVVTWTVGSTPHNVTYTPTAGAPANIPTFQDGSASSTFPTNGSFNYHCTIHPVMTGTVTVH
jgi:plastocyanin